VRVIHEHRFWPKVEKNGPLWQGTPCWLWLGVIDRHGYGQYHRYRAHRVAFFLTHGYWPPDDLDHLCRVHNCVNPAHLEPVTRRVNLLRGETVTARNAAVTHCPAGHEYSPENTRLQFRPGTIIRKCKTCHREWERARRRRAA
jgi:hypothetical protein